MKRVCPRLLAISAGNLTSSVPSGDWKRFFSWLDELPDHREVAVQIREKGLSELDCLRLCQQARAAFSGTLLVNGRPDIALAADLDGVHLPSAGLEPARVVRRFGHNLLVGVSAHSIREIETAKAAGVDYAVFGPVYSTPAKTDLGHGPQGLETLRKATGLGLRVLAIGGIGPQQACDAFRVGAYGVAAMRAASTRAGIDRLLGEVTSPAR